MDGQDIRKIKLSDLRNHIGIVQQDVFLFADRQRPPQTEAAFRWPRFQNPVNLQTEGPLQNVKITAMPAMPDIS